ncbi:hypothetical protein HPB47_016361 [Ixodes persulcatus]|uniref:Uncharacterized protein n=1 Tax=Ixodes persulcatus TaxID=34615 RepID=A0AC60R126_IXOPE|nr:hypothetical protein HPB47_016361 [Ixodes persulcatus]
MIRTTRRGADSERGSAGSGGRDERTGWHGPSPSSLSLFLPSLSLFLRERWAVVARARSAARRAAEPPSVAFQPCNDSVSKPEEPRLLKLGPARRGMLVARFHHRRRRLATCGTRTIEDIVDEMKEPEQQSDSDGEDCGGSEEAPSTSETLHALDVLRRAVRLGHLIPEIAASAELFVIRASIMAEFSTPEDLTPLEVEILRRTADLGMISYDATPTCDVDDSSASESCSGSEDDETQTFSGVL